MPYRILALSLALATLLVAGCSKPNQTLTKPKSVSLGTVALTYGTPSRQDLGDNVVCVLTAQPLSAGACELMAVLEQSGKQVATTRIAPAPLDQPLQITLGNAQIELTPHVK